MIQLPRISKPTSGLFRSPKTNIWYTWWTEDGERVQRTTGTRDPDEARKIRDARHRDLRQRGAVTAGSREAALSGDRYIYEQPPYIVRVPGRPQETAETRAEARQKRNALLNQ